MKHSFLLFAFIVLCALSANSATQHIPFNDNWKFILADNQSFAQPEFNDADWRTLSVPHDWSIEGKYDKSNPSGPQGGFMPCGTGWYRKHFTLDASMSGKRVFINFDGVYMKSQVWINGRMVGEYPNGYNAFHYDITPFVKFGGADNVLAVKVDNSLQPGSRWYSGSGIYRDVTLTLTEQMHFMQNGTFVTTPLVTAQKAKLAVKAKIINNRYPETVFHWTDNTDLYVWTRSDSNKTVVQGANRRISKPVDFTFSLCDLGGKVLATHTVTREIGDFTQTTVADSLSISNPALWSPDSPNLYKLLCSISIADSVIDSQTITVGFRDIKFSPESGMTVNGKPEKLKGVCLHQNVGPFGTAVPRDVWRARLLSLKDMGCNALRLSHYPFPAYFYDLCDSLGFFVSNEIFDEWNRGQEWGYSETSYGKMPYTYHLYFNQWAETDLRRMISRDRNHPCVMLYVLGNEIPNQRIEGNDIARRLVKIAKDEDPTRPVTAACDFFVGANKAGFLDCFDIAGYNYIDRIHTDSLYAQEHAIYPNRILLGTETYNSADNPIWVKKTKSCIGEFIWVGFDYLGEIVWDGDRGWNESMNDIAGFPKPEFFLRKAYWSARPTVHAGVTTTPAHPDFAWRPASVADHWNWVPDTTLNVVVFSNCKEVELQLNGRSLGRKAVDADSCFAKFPAVHYKTGTLKAIAYNGGKRRVAEHTLVTTAATPSQLVFSNVKGDKIDYIEVAACDKRGHRIPSYCGTAAISASGCRIVGIDNGNQHDPQGKKYTSASQGDFFEGRLRLYVDKTTAGSVTVTIPGVKPLVMTLRR